MNRLLLYTALFAANGALAACDADGVKNYAVQAGALEHRALTDGGDEYTQTVGVRAEGDADALHSTTRVETHLQKGGYRNWRSETRSARNQLLVLEHDDAFGKMKLYVDGHGPLIVNERPDGKLEHAGRIHGDDARGIDDLAGDLAEELENLNVDHDAIVACFTTGLAVRDEVDKEAKFFFTSVWVDVFAPIMANIGINAQIGANNTNTNPQTNTI